MTIEFTSVQLKAIASNLGFAEIRGCNIMEDNLRIYGMEDGQFAEASLFIDFKTKAIYVSVYLLGNTYLDGKEKKFKLDF